MKKILAAFFFLSTPFLVLAQNPDSAAIASAIDSLNELNKSLSEQQKFDEALVVIEAAKEQATAAFGKEHPAYAKSVFNHGLTFDDMGDYEKAELLYLEAKDIRERVLGKEHPDYAFSLNNLAVLYAITGDYEKAEPLYLETISIREKVLGKEHHEYAFGLINLANLYHYLGTYEKAEPLYLEAVNILKKVLGEEHPHYASSLANLAFLYYKMSHYEKAEPLYLEAKSIREKVLGKEHPHYAGGLDNLAILYTDMGNYEKAEPLYLEVINIQEKVLGKEHPYYAYSLVNLATLYRYTDNYEKAELLYLEAISILEKVLGREHPDRISSLGNLALLYTDMGNYEKAEPLYLETISIQEKALGREHPHYAHSLTNLASYYTVAGDHEKAEPLYLKAKSIQEKALGKEHRYYAESLINLASHYAITGDREKAGALYLEADPIQKKLLLKASRFASERELAAYARQFNQILSQIHSFQQIYADAQLNGLCYNQALFYKGFLLNTSRQIRRLAAADTASAARFDLLASYHRRLAAEYARPIAERQGVETLEEKANQTEKELTRSAAGFGQALRQVDWREVQAQLKAGEAAIEFVHYQFLRTKPASDSTMYAALVLKPGGAPPQFIPLFEEREIAAAAGAPEAGRADYANQLYAFAGRGLKPRKAEEKTLLELNWQPLEKQLQGAQTIYYAPSGILHRLNLSAIPINEKEVLGDKYRLIRLGSTRQLAAPHPGTAGDGGALLFGGVRYEMDSTAISRANAGREDNTIEPALSFQQTARSLRGDSWQYLAWTEKEVSEIAAILKKANIETSVQYGFAASEEAFSQIGQGQPSPRILHLATHGFFFPDPATASEGGGLAANSSPLGGGWEGASAFKASDHPMIRSGLILAGGNHAWQGKEPVAGLEDGVLTAYEISQMDLSDTELVVLSACETGLGDIEGNEGVYGLQRAFKIAGARYLIMSLWQVPDRETMEFMVAFYQNWLEEKMGLPEAFRAAQQAMREKYKNPYLWAAFVLVE